MLTSVFVWAQKHDRFWRCRARCSSGCNNRAPAGPDESAPLRRPKSSGGSAVDSDGNPIDQGWWASLQLRKHPRRALCIAVATLFVAGLIAALVVASRNKSSPAETERQYEQQFQSNADPNRLRTNLFYYTNESHIAGSPADEARAYYTAQKMREYGIPDVRIEKFNVLLSYPQPNSRRLAIVSGSPVGYNGFEASLRENVLPSDPTSGKASVDTFLSYSASGNVTAPLVYANYGRLSDYEALTSKGVSVSGCVVIARYGQIFRGNIVSNAEYHGAVGVIIFSDPSDDGSGMGGVYPNAPGWRPPSGVQRGTIWNGNGDPLTPGYPSIDMSPRITMDQAHMNNYSYGTPLSRIPSLPIGYGDAYPLLKSLIGAPLPNATTWQGGLNFTYMVGPGPVQVNLRVALDTSRRDIWNVVGRIPGSVEPDRVVVLGNHRDAWTFGAGDPNSGSATLLEVANGFGQLLASGWTPRRSIVLCSWDAEEYALIGSVEHTELHEKELMSGAIAYLNVDVGVSTIDTLAIMGVPSMAAMVRSATQSVPAPQSVFPGASLYTMCQWSQGGAGNSGGGITPMLNAGGMGTGSDYGGFMQHLGVPALDLRFESDPNSYSGVYHSNYDSFTWLTSPWSDPNFVFHAALCNVWGVIAMRLADTPLLPFAFTEYAQTLQGDIQQLQAQFPPAPAPAPSLNFTDLLVASNTMVATSQRLDAALLAMGAGTDDAGTSLTDLQLRMWNDKLMLAERSFLWLQGVPGREWYRHLVWVAGLYDVYGSTAFSTISDAMAVNDYTDAQIQIQMCALALKNFNDFLLFGNLF